jgi:transposase
VLNWFGLSRLYCNGIFGKKRFVLRRKLYKKRADEDATDWGHEVLRLPPHHCIFNPIEMIWTQLKGNLKRNNTSRNPKFSEQTTHLIKEEMSNIDSTKWANCERHVIEVACKTS